jgi:fumarate reductase flavoprotein subunit
MTTSGTFSIEVDVLVVGAGGCGLAAALAARQGGSEVLVAERMSVPLPNTTRSTGMIPAAGSRWQVAAGIDDAPATFAADIDAKTHGTADSALVARLTTIAPDLVAWLNDDAGVELEFVQGFHYPGHSRERMHAPADRSGATVMKQLRRSVVTSGVDIVNGAPVTELIVDDAGTVRGAVIDNAGSVERVAASAVILAANGFGANHAMLHQYCPSIADAPYLGGEGSTGDAIRWGISLGAATACMDAFQGHASVAIPHNSLLSWSTVMSGGILVNQHGARFGNESAGYSEFATEVLAQPGGIAYLVIDEQIHLEAMAFEDYRQAAGAGALKSAATPHELAERMGLPPLALSRALDDVIESAQRGTADRFGRTFTRPLAGPLRAAKVTGALFHTQGGLVVDEHARVLRGDGTIIDGLYAGGGVAQGLSGHGAAGYLSGNGLLSAFGLGWLAGRHASGRPVPPST